MKRSELKIGQHYKWARSHDYSYVKVSENIMMYVSGCGRGGFGSIARYNLRVDNDATLIGPIPIKLDDICRHIKC